MKDNKNVFHSDEIRENSRRTAEIYMEAAQMAEKIVEESYAAEDPDGKPEFPVDIELVAKKLDIHVSLRSLNTMGTQFNRVLAILLRYNDQATILVDDKVGYKTRRYAMANAIARYLLKDQTSIFTSSYAIPLIPQSLEEISADMIALFMLMPVKLFKNEFRDYIQKTSDRPMDVDQWLEHLSDRTQISPFNLAIGYQQMKMVLCHEHQQQLKEQKGDNLGGIEDPYGMIFA